MGTRDGVIEDRQVRAATRVALRRLRRCFALRPAELAQVRASRSRSETVRVAVALAVPPGQPSVTVTVEVDRSRAGWLPTCDGVEVTVGDGAAEKWGTATDVRELEVLLPELRAAHREHRHPRDVTWRLRRRPRLA